MNSKIIKHLMKHVMEDDEDREVGKTFPCKPEWSKRFAALEKQADEISKMKSKMTSQTEGLWAEIKESLDLYGEDLHYSQEDNEIQVYLD